MNNNSNINNNQTNEYIDIFYNGKIYKIYREYTESFDQFYNRAWFIAKKEPQNGNEFKTIEIKSKIWRNTKYLDMRYN
jgi:hypothetical protein